MGNYPEHLEELINSYLQNANLYYDVHASIIPQNEECDIISLLYKNIEEAERTRANMKRYCWVLSMDSFYKICAYFDVEYRIDKSMTIMGYKAKCSSLLPPNTIIFADILWGDEDDELST